MSVEKPNYLYFDDHKKLEQYLDEVYIPKYTKSKRIIHSDGSYEYEDYVNINHLVIGELDEDMLRYAIEYIVKKGFQILGYQDELDLDSIQFDYNVNMKCNINAPEPLEWEIQKELFKEYKITGNPEIRKKLIESNVRLVIGFTKKYAYRYKIPYKNLLDYGIDVLLCAIESFDLNKKVCFSTYLTHSLKKRYTTARIKVSNFRKLSTYKIYNRYQNPDDSIDDVIINMQNSQTLTISEIKSATKELNFMNPLDIMSKEVESDSSNYSSIDNLFDKIYYNSIINDIFPVSVELEKEIVIDYCINYVGYRNRVEIIAEKYNLTEKNILRIVKTAIRKIQVKVYTMDFSIGRDYNYDEVPKRNNR